MKKLWKRKGIAVIFFISIFSGFFYNFNHFGNFSTTLDQRNRIPNRANEVLNASYSFFSSYFGGSEMEVATGVCVSDLGEIFIIGYTASPDFPLVNAFDSTIHGIEGFVTKLNPDFSINFSSFIGDSMDNYPRDIVVDDSGRCYIVGSDMSRPTHNVENIFLKILNPDGSLHYSDEIHDVLSGDDFMWDMCGIDVNKGTGEYYITGAYDSGAGAFVVKYHSNGTLTSNISFSGVSWGDTICEAIAVDEMGMIYVVGSTYDKLFPIVDGFITEKQGNYDAFFIKFNPDGSINYSTYLGGEDYDYGRDLDINSKGDCIVVGRTASTDYPMFNAYDTSFGDDVIYTHEGFVTKFNSDNSLNYSSYIGGKKDDESLGVAVCEDGSAYITGTSTSDDLPMRTAYHSQSLGSVDGFLLNLDENGEVNFSTYIGGTYCDKLFDIEVFNDKICYLVGWTTSTDIYQIDSIDPLEDLQDAYIVKMLPPLEDYDEDGLVNLYEYSYRSDPNNRDSDRDGILDGLEHDQGTDPANPDTDNDGIPDGEDRYPNSYFFPKGLMFLGIGLFMGTIIVLWIKIKPITKIRRKTLQKEILQIRSILNQSEYQSEYQSAKEKLANLRPRVENFGDGNLEREWDLLYQECENDIYFISELTQQKLLIDEGSLEMAHSKLIALLKNVSGTDSEVLIDKKIVSDIVDLIKKTSEQLEKK